MNIEQIKQIAVIGAGTMGSQIAMVCALAGYSVYLQDVHEEGLKKAENTLRGLINRNVNKGKLTNEQADEAFSRLHLVLSLEAAVKDTDFVIEAIIENLDAKRKLFTQLDKMAPAHAIFATNSSFMVSSKLADATLRPGQVCNMHFFNPVLVMELVEVVQGPHTSEETAHVAKALCEKIGKLPILLKKEIPGFVANRILNKVLCEAAYLLENEIASADEIDLACTKALNYPIGPFALIDLMGIDVYYHASLHQYEESGNEADKPFKLLVEKYEKGEFGRKTGKGFYEYADQAFIKQT